MESNAKQIRDRYKELLDDGVPHSRKELFAYAKEDVEENAYTIGMLTGALKSLVDSSDIYQSMGRGIYQKVELSEKSSNKISARYLNIFKRTLEETSKESVNPMVLLEIDEDEKKKMKEIQECIRKIKRTVEHLRNKERTKVEKCFVIMPFEKNLDEVYHRLIKPTVEKKGYEVKRSDEIYGNQPIIEDITTEIRTANVLIADVTGKNPKH